MNNNLLECRNGLVHANSAEGLDYTLCGVSASDLLKDGEEYTAEMSINETETEPYMKYTGHKINCPTCAAIIRFCCKLGLKSLSRKENTNEKILDNL